MEQVIIDENSNIEIEKLYIILRKAQKQVETEEITQQYKLHEFFRDLNPRYVEEGVRIKDAMDKIYSSDAKFRSIFDFSRMF
jgi:hypothetical protein